MSKRLLATLITVLVAALSSAGPTVTIGFGAGGGSTDPTIAGTDTGTAFNATTSATIDFDTLGTISAGDLLIGWVPRDGTIGVSGSVAVTGYTINEFDTANSSMGAIAYKTAAGGETSPSATWTGSEHGEPMAMRVTGWSATAFGTAALGTSTAPNPPAVTCTPPAQILAFCVLNSDGTDSFNGNPTGFTQQTDVQNTAANRVSGRVASCYATAGTDCSSLDPPVFSTTGAISWGCQTMCVED